MNDVAALVPHRESCTLYTTDKNAQGHLHPRIYIVRMHTCRFSPEQTWLLTEIGPRQQCRILKRFRKTDNVLAEKNDPILQGRPPQMIAEDIAVSSWNALCTSSCWCHHLMDDSQVFNKTERTQPPAIKFCMHLCMTIKIETYISDFETVENWVCNGWKVIQTPFSKLRFFVVVQISQK
jgi:hypothetical protein